MKKRECVIDRCDDCRWGTYDDKFENMSLNGKPTLIICKYNKYKIVVGSIACEKFSKRNGK